MSSVKNKKFQKTNRKQRSSPLPVFLALGGLVLMIAAFFALSQPSKTKAPIEVAGSPSLKVDKEKVDLGAVKLGQTVQVEFELTNVGDETLRFSKQPTIEVKEGC